MRINKFLTIISFFLLSIEVFAHARIQATSVIPPRSRADNLKTGPCGGVAKTNNPASLQANTVIDVAWEETVNHPGRYEFWISYDNDQTWQLLEKDDGTKAIYYDDKNRGQWLMKMRVPNRNCTNCTIQMIQVMTENTSNPRNYYSCSDVTIVNATSTSQQVSITSPVSEDRVAKAADKQLEGSPMDYQAYKLSAEGRAFFDQSLRPVLQNRCVGCHADNGGLSKMTQQGQFPYLMSPAPALGGKADTNDMIRKISGGLPHAGGNICGGNVNATPCKQIQDWWNVEFGEND